MRIFLTIWLGQLVSAFGTGLGSFALGVWIYEKTGSATQFAMIGFIVGVTVILVAPVAGTLADLWDRRKLLILSDLGSGLVTLLMASLLLNDLLQPWHVYPIVATMVAFSALQGPALTSSISLLVPREHLARASGMTQMSRSVAQILGPLTAGALVGRIGYHGVVYIDAVSFLFALGTVLLVRIPSPPGASPAGRRSLFRDFTYGWSYLRSRGGLLALMGLFAVTNFSMGVVQTLLTPLILSFATPIELATVNSAGAAGVLLGSIALALWGGPKRRTLAIFGILLAQGALLFLGGVQPSVPLIAVATFLFMISIPIINACNQVILQRKVAPEVQGRVFAMAGIIASCTLPLAALASGPLADRVFEPALAPGGALTDSIGLLIGTGPGRGVGLLFVTLGAFVILVVCLAFLNPRLRRVETELPDTVTAEPPPASHARPVEVER
jgi:MFS family permease